MQPSRRWWILVIAVLAVGCGGSPGATPAVAPGPPQASGPHNGPALPLPGGSGYAEVVAETGRPGAGPSVAVYFLKPDLKSPLSPLPSDARVTIANAGGSPRELALAASPKPGDRSGGGRMASPPVSIDPDRFSGELRATVAGQPLTAPFAVGQ